MRPGSNLTYTAGDPSSIRDPVPGSATTKIFLGTETDWLQAAPGGVHVCARRSEGLQNTLWCWGRNANGELGVDGTWGETPRAVVFP